MQKTGLSFWAAKNQLKKLTNDTYINRKWNARCRRFRNTKKFKLFVVRELRKQNKGRTPEKIKAFVLRKIIKPKKMGIGKNEHIREG